jgi:hypothetical protein
LKFTIGVPSPSPISGQPFELELSLEHGEPGAAPISACVGVSHEFRALAVPSTTAGRARKPLDGEIKIIDHPRCERPFTLRAGETLKWRETTQLNVGPGPAELSGWVAIVHPKDCDRYGCYETHFEAPAFRVDFK